jgi:hypothetical protein
MGRPRLDRTKVCPRCGVTFVPKDWRNTFCGRRCSKLKDQPTKPCERCGREFEKDRDWSLAYWEARRFCSMACRGNGKIGWTMQVCALCGKTCVLGHIGRLYCSQACYFVSLRTERYPVRNRRRGQEFSDRMKRLILERAGYRCEQCGATERLQYDHIVPCHRGGTNDVANGQALCGDCHGLKTRSEVLAITRTDSRHK